MSYHSKLPTIETALPGRAQAISVDPRHFVNGHSIFEPFPENCERIYFGMGCFWGAEKKFWSLSEVYSTAVGYAQGLTPNPLYEEVCSGLTGHNEAVLVVYDATRIGLFDLLKVFWENHDPTQGMRQGNDIGTQYRSAIYTCNAVQQREATESRVAYQQKLNKAGYETISTEVELLRCFYYAENYHQQYLAKNPNGYCGLGGTGVRLC